MLLHDSAAHAVTSVLMSFMAAFHWQGKILVSALLSQSCKENGRDFCISKNTADAKASKAGIFSVLPFS